MTWISTDQTTQNQIDHMTISVRWPRTMEDVMVYRGAYTGSDHELVIASLKVRLAKAPVTVQQRTKRFDTSRLSLPVQRHELSIALQNRFQTLTDQDDHYRCHVGTDQNIIPCNMRGETMIQEKHLQELAKPGHHSKDRETQDHQEPTSSSQDKDTETGSPKGIQRAT